MNNLVLPSSLQELLQWWFPLWSALAALGLAQVLKIIIMSLRHNKLGLHYFFSTGGMPSSHSAMVVGLTVGVGQTTGWFSSEFCIAAIFSFVVLYDAANIRKAAGTHAAIINKMIATQVDLKEFEGEKLRELLGHTKNEVLVGAGLGIVTSILLNMVVFL